jgi:DNA-binding transcriptional MerR regulator
MPRAFSIGDFSRATHLTVKSLRHYHEEGLLEPAQVDPETGYRRYSPDQIPVAHIIRRFRDLDMPLSDIRAILAAKDLGVRNELISSHLARLESQLESTQAAVASLRNLLQHPASDPDIGRRRVEATVAASIRDVVGVGDLLAWYLGALGELRASLAAQHLAPSGPAGGMFANALFTQGRGEATMFMPCAGAIRPIGRVLPCTVPAVDLATILHAGSHRNVDLAYGALASYVARHTVGLDQPLREYYLIGPHETPDESAWRTEIGWPIFQTG